ncbi:respiratory nitrate reductase subunit gamma (plasmid) [Rhodococcus qingshengii]|jgi:nitrate reductase gamma subunit|uniref:respiratory nitrate reductase subunit gamma n=1 Tax=Rhodococcus TaxID=1827 RepID=UPI0004A91FA3|nr:MULTISPECIES: respiratory nitrate reductase subunit gamma [Rhodococcus]KDQ00373.1 nitrate reductase [Rhodococcus qingshengii]QEM25428.1 respiratory nitrate reductase subunit gamma [Rhodococcus qingshengii]
MDWILWGVLPYLVIALLIGGTIWRYRYDKFGWTTRSSELYESRLLRIGSPLFHFGILVVIMGHAIGLVIPESWTEFFGISENLYHLNSAFFGLIAGICTLTGLAILIYRRRTTGPVYMATTRNDKVMYIVLTAALLLGFYCTLLGALPDQKGVNYRETVSPWFRSIFYFQPDVDAMNNAPLRFHIHVLVGMLVFAAVPFTRLVHMFTAPVHYLFRPYIVYRSRDRRSAPGNQQYRRGWAPAGVKDRDR